MSDNLVMHYAEALFTMCFYICCMTSCNITSHVKKPTKKQGAVGVIRSRTRQNFELVHIIGPVENFGPPARNFGPLRAEFAWRE